MHYVSVMKIRKIRELQLTNVRTLLIQVCLGPSTYVITLYKLFLRCMLLTCTVPSIDNVEKHDEDHHNNTGLYC